MKDFLATNPLGFSFPNPQVTSNHLTQATTLHFPLGIFKLRWGLGLTQIPWILPQVGVDLQCPAPHYPSTCSSLYNAAPVLCMWP